MNSVNNPPYSSRAMVTLAAFVVVIAGMRASATILVPFLLSAFIAIVVSPLMFWLRRKGVPAAVALGVMIFGLVVGILLFSSLIGSSVQRFTQDLPEYQAKLGATITTVRQWLGNQGFEYVDTEFMEVDPAALMGVVATGLNSLGRVVKNTFLIVMTVSFMLVEAFNLPVKLKSAIGGERDDMLSYNQFLETMNRYMAIKTATSMITGLVITIFLLVVGIDYALMWGFLAFFLNYVPTIGSFIAAIPAVLLAIVQMGFGHAALIAGGYLVINIVISNLIEPKFMGRGLGLSTLVVFLSLVFWGWVLGPVGMLLSVPLTITVKIALESSPKTRKVAIFLGT